MKNSKITVIAGPCSVDEKNIDEIRQIGQIAVVDSSGKSVKAIAGTRIVGLKSRTELNPDGQGMGIDYPVYKRNLLKIIDGASIDDLEVLPSALMAESIVKETGMIIATEVMNPLVQLPSYVGRIPRGKLMPWNPAVSQLGWQIQEMAVFARKHGWHIGLKNGKWIGDHLEKADSEEYKGKTTMEKTWIGLVKYIEKIDHDVVLIHRGVDVPGKGNFRNAPVHALAKRVKRDAQVKMFFDPSHTYGPKMRDHIVEGTVSAMQMKLAPDEFLYDGILIEAGTSSTDTDQHITLAELADLAQKLSKIRKIAVRN